MRIWLLLALLCAMVRTCPILRSSDLKLKTSYPDTEVWLATVELTQWQTGVVITIVFPQDDIFHDAHVTQAAWGEIDRDTPPVAALRLLDAEENRIHRNEKTGFYELIVEGTGGCFGAAGSEETGLDAATCDKPTVSCDLAPFPDPPPAAPPMMPPPPLPPTLAGTPRLTHACGDTVEVQWDPPPFAISTLGAAYPMEYKVHTKLVEGSSRSEAITNSDVQSEIPPVLTTNTHASVMSLAPGQTYIITIASRLTATGREEPWQVGPQVTVSVPTDAIDPAALVITPGASTQSCSSLELTLPSLSPDPWKCHSSDFLSVEWRVASASEPWQSLLDRVDRDDLPNNLLVVDELDPYEAFEFRVQLHHFERGASSGRIIVGPPTGALLVGMLRNELLNAPMATALSSASVEIVLPHISHCRELLRSSIWYATTPTSPSSEEDWEPIPQTELVREGRHVRARSLRCPNGCRFRWSTEDVKGWDEVSAVSESVTTPELPALKPSTERVELRLGAHFGLGTPPLGTADWRQRFGTEISSALGLAPASVDVVEVRENGEYVMLDVPSTRSDDHATPPSPRSALAALMQQPACTHNMALQQPGRCSSSCGNGTSPAHVNDDDLRQYAPHVWSACDYDTHPWWSVQLPQTMSRPYVRVLFGDCCAHSVGRTIEVHIGPASGLARGVKCASLIVDDGSSVGARCEGEGEWVTIAASGSFALAEVQVCDAGDVNKLLHGQLASNLDTSAGLLAEAKDGTHLEQVAPMLLSLVPPGRDAAWRMSAGASRSGAVALSMSQSQLALLAGATAVLFVALVCALSRTGECCSRRSFARVGHADHHEGPESPDEDDTLFSDGGNVPWGRTSIPVTFERSDGSKVSAQVSLAGIDTMEQIFVAVKTAATRALGGPPVEHVSLQYMSESLQFDEAWYDPILGEGSDLKSVARARQWRVLILGTSSEASLAERGSPSRYSAQTSSEFMSATVDAEELVSVEL